MNSSKKVQKRSSNEPIGNYICRPCGEKLGSRTPQGVTTWHTGTCDYCKETTGVCGVRHFGYPRIKKEND